MIVLQQGGISINAVTAANGWTYIYVLINYIQSPSYESKKSAIDLYQTVKLSHTKSEDWN
jgi:hypothetical protein